LRLGTATRLETTTSRAKVTLQLQPMMGPIKQPSQSWNLGQNNRKSDAGVYPSRSRKKA
jgi:hypothetical protein